MLKPRIQTNNWRVAASKIMRPIRWRFARGPELLPWTSSASSSAGAAKKSITDLGFTRKRCPLIPENASRKFFAKFTARWRSATGTTEAIQFHPPDRKLEIRASAAVLTESSESLVKGLFVAVVCNECGSTVTRRLLYCSDDAAVYHLECTNGHKLHRVASRSPGQLKDSEAGKPSPAFVIVESCDCT